MRDQDDDYEDFEDEPPFPMTVTLAGAGWIAFGGLILITSLINLVGAVAAPGPVALHPGAEVGAQKAGRTCGGIFAALIGGAFVFVGVQTVRGTAKDTLGNSVGSILFGTLYLGLSVLVLIAGSRRAGAVEGMIMALLMLLFAAGLIGAGILGLSGRKAYREWRRFEKNRL